MELLIVDKSPALGYGIAVAVGENIFIHGGTENRTTDQSHPTNSCHIFDCAKHIWLNLTVSNSPSLSFHCAYVTDDRFVHLIGGWNGKHRSSCVYIYDVRDSKWLPTCKTIGFPNGAGLSGHAIIPIIGGGCLITGRLGGLQTQRRSGSILTLRPVAFPTVYKYDILSELLMQSRSGHTCTPLKNAKTGSCLILGGRDKDGAELLQYDQILRDASSDPVEFSRHGSRSNLNFPPSRRYHIAVPIHDKGGIGNGVLMHGGEDFASICKGPSNQGPCAALVSSDPQTVQLKSRGPIHVLEEFEKTPRLTGHKAVKVKDKIFVLGGFSDKWQLNKHIYELKL